MNTNIKHSILELVGKTPLLMLPKLNQSCLATIYAKCEMFNPSGSVKDRAALAMIEAAETEGLIDQDTVIIEPTSGNTGIALAMVCAVKGYRLIITMPESMTIERQRLLKAYGAELHLSAAHLQMSGAIELAKTLAEKYPKTFIPQQFNNKANPEMHMRTTAVEIWEDLKGQIDVVVLGVGTGGTITGLARYFKSKKADIKIIAVEPKDSAVLSGKDPGPHMIQGIGAGFIPSNCDTHLIDEIICVENMEAVETAKQLAIQEGVLVGISAGANMFAALQCAKQKRFKGQTVVTILCDVGERYLSTNLMTE